MIDTVVLLIPKEKMLFIDESSTGALPWQLQSVTDNYQKFVKNPPKRMKISGLYYPRLTGYKRNTFIRDDNVRIEFSAPKLLYNNNLDELEDTDFVMVIEALKSRLRDMGVIVENTTLEQASVSSVHFSKNILLTDGYTARHLISEMNKVDLRKTFDFARTRYINDGQSLYAHSTSHQLVIYDKVADLDKDNKRAIDKNQTSFQQSLFETLSKDKTLSEIIRFEIRLSQRQKLKKVLKKFGYTDNPLFKDVFSKALSQKVVQDYWQTIIRERNLGLFSIPMGHKDILQKVFSSQTGIKPKQAIYLAGLYVIGKDENGLRELRSIVDKNSHNRTWYRISKDLEMVGDLISKNRMRSWVTQIDKNLDEYITFRLNFDEKVTHNH